MAAQTVYVQTPSTKTKDAAEYKGKFNHGSIWFLTESFSIFLKRYQDQSIPSKKADGIHEPAIIAEDLTGKGRILLVEDEVPVRLFSAKALINKGYDVIDVESGQAGLSVIKAEGKTIDLIITDVIMPGITGPAMVQEILKTYPDIKVIYISGYAEDVFINTYGVERGFHFLSKPYSLKQLAAKVKEVLLLK